MKIEDVLILFMLINLMWFCFYMSKRKLAKDYFKKWVHYEKKYYDTHVEYSDLKRKLLNGLTPEAEDYFIDKKASEYAETQIVRGKNLPDWDETVKRLICRYFKAGYEYSESKHKS